MTNTRTLDLVLALDRKYLSIYQHYDRYRGVVLLHSLARLAVADRDDEALVSYVRNAFMPYARDEREFPGNFPNYRCGGLGASYLLWQGLLPEAEAAVRKYAREIMDEAPRDPDGILCHPKAPAKKQIWIDAAYAVSAFLLFAGLACDEKAWVEDAFQHTAKMVRILRNPDNGLLHQGRGFNPAQPDGISADHWSRGNGWGIYALNELACYLPESHPRRDEARALYTDLLEACAAHQDDEGLWHQEIPLASSYVETSGSALLLYAIGCGLQNDLLAADPWRARFERGLRGLLAYISDQYDLFHTCDSCLCPGEGTVADYLARPPILNDSHAFGPFALAFGQAHVLGISSLCRS
jgi:unsaturated rhamnogalacturonyl hydrolase